MSAGEEYKLMNDIEKGDSPDEMLLSHKEMSITNRIRLGFIRKVYGILCFQLLATTLMSAFSMISNSFFKFQAENLWILLICALGAMCLPCFTLCFDNLLRKHPDNYIFLGLFTFFESYLVSFICGATNPRIVLMAVCMTLGLVISLTVYAMTTKTDFTMSGGILFILCGALLMFSLFAIFTTNKIVHVALSTLWIVLLGVYLIYDTQLILGNNERKLSEDDYVLASFMLYVDIITIFIEMLRILTLLFGDER